jgi:hypothetical protein
MRLYSIAFPAALLFLATQTDSCNDSDDVQRSQQEVLLGEATAKVGMPSVKNFRERKFMKDIIEMRDQDGLSTFTYLWSDIQGRWIFFCYSIGYGLPYATQFTNPQKISGGSSYRLTLPQADPNGLFSPASADGTWVLCKDPNGKDVKPVLIEPRCIVSPFELSKQEAPIEVPEGAVRKK